METKARKVVQCIFSDSSSVVHLLPAAFEAFVMLQKAFLCLWVVKRIDTVVWRQTEHPEPPDVWTVGLYCVYTAVSRTFEECYDSQSCLRCCVLVSVDVVFLVSLSQLWFFFPSTEWWFEPQPSCSVFRTLVNLCQCGLCGVCKRTQ